MGCAASTTITNGDDDNTLLKREGKNEDLTQLNRAAADSGDLSIKDANVYGDQLESHPKITEEDTNFHNSPSNIMNDPVSIISNNAEMSTNPGRVSATSTVSHKDETTKTKTTDAANGNDEPMDNDDTKQHEQASEKEFFQSATSPHHSPVYKPTETSSDDGDSQMSTKISQDLSKENEAASIPDNPTGTNAVHDTDNTLNKDNSTIQSRPQSEAEKSEKESRSSHTLTGSNRSPYFDSINVNANDVNQNHDGIINLDKTLMGTGDINQNHQLLSDYCKNEALVICDVNAMTSFKKDLSATGDIEFEKLDPSINDDNNTLDFGVIELHNDPLVDHSKNVSLSRTSQISAISRQVSSSTPSFNHGYLKTAEVNDTNFEIESLNAFEMKDMTIDFNQAENEAINLSECNNDAILLPDNEEALDEQFNGEE